MGLAKPKAEVQGDIDPRIRVRFVTGADGVGKVAVARRLLERADGVARAIVLPSSFAPHAFGPCPKFVGDDGLTLFADGDVCIPMIDGLLAALNRLHLGWMGNLGPALYYDAVVVVVPAAIDVAHYVTQLHTDPRLDLTYLFDGIDTVVGPDDVSALDTPEAEKRLAETDAVVIDAGPADTQRIVRAVGAVNPFAEIPVSGVVKPIPIIGDSDLNRTVGGTCLVNNLFNDRRSNRPGGGVIRALRAEVPGATNIQRLHGLIQELRGTLGDNLFRLRITTHIRNGDYPIGFQVVGRSWTPPFYEFDPGPARTRLRIVARGLQAERTFDQLRSCVWLDDDVTARRVPLF